MLDVAELTAALPSDEEELADAAPAVALAVPVVDTLGDNYLNIPRSYWKPNRVLAYTTGGGGIAWTDEAIALFPNIILIDQAIGSSMARKAWSKDVESGAGRIVDLVEIAKQRLSQNLDSIFYLPQSWLTLAREALAAAGIATPRTRIFFFVANWNLSESEAVHALGGDIVAVQWASPSSNPGTILPGSNRTLGETNCDLSASVHNFPGLTPPELPPVDHHPERFPLGPFDYTDPKTGNLIQLNERHVMLSLYGALQHPEKYAGWIAQLKEWGVFLRKRVWRIAHEQRMATLPAGGWLPDGAHFNWQHPDQGRDFVTNWQGPILAPGDGVCKEVRWDYPFPNGFGSDFPLVTVNSGAFRGHTWYIGHCSTRVKPGQQFKTGEVLAVADQGKNFLGTTGGWVELGTEMANGRLGPYSTSGHWFDHLLENHVQQVSTNPLDPPSWPLFWRGYRWQAWATLTK